MIAHSVPTVNKKSAGKTNKGCKYYIPVFVVSSRQRLKIGIKKEPPDSSGSPNRLPLYPP